MQYKHTVVMKWREENAENGNSSVFSHLPLFFPPFLSSYSILFFFYGIKYSKYQLLLYDFD